MSQEQVAAAADVENAPAQIITTEEVKRELNVEYLKDDPLGLVQDFYFSKATDVETGLNSDKVSIHKRV